MIIKDVRTTLLKLPWVEVPRASMDEAGSGIESFRELVVVEIETESGIVGMGYLHVLGGGLKTIEACLAELIVPRLIGRDATEVEAIWHDLYKSTYWVGRMGIVLFAISAVDIALWDAVGKRANLPLHRLWGSYRTRIPAYGSGCFRGLGPDGMIDKAQRFVSQGFKAIKMQVAHINDWRTDVEHVRRMREALGPDIDIMIDVNMGWTADQAIQAGRRFEDYDVYWLEEPVVAEDIAGYFNIAEKLDLRIVGGESHFTRHDLRPFFENPRLPILQPDVMRGGLTELRKIATLADTWGMTVAPHLFPELMVQLMASIPNGLTIEYMNFLDDLWVDPVMPEEGTFTVPERPGHGLAFKPEVLADHKIN